LAWVGKNSQVTLQLPLVEEMVALARGVPLVSGVVLVAPL
jgi:hypothetical protein